MNVWVVLFVFALAACTSTPRVPSVAILITVPRGSVLSPAEVASVYAVVQPEIEKRGYVVAKAVSAADFVVYITDPVDPLGATGGRLRLERYDQTRTFDKLAAQSSDIKQRAERANREMVTEPKE